MTYHQCTRYFKQHKDVQVEEDEDDADYKCDEPDENDAYDRWRDRQLEGDY